MKITLDAKPSRTWGVTEQPGRFSSSRFGAVSSGDRFVRGDNPAKSALRFASSESPTGDNALKGRLEHPADTDDLLDALGEAADNGDGSLVPSILKHLDNAEAAFDAADAIVGMANRGVPEAVRAYVDTLLNYVPQGQGPAQGAEVRGLALRSFFDPAIQGALQQADLMDAFWENVRAFRVPEGLATTDETLFREELMRTLHRPEKEEPAIAHVAVIFERMHDKLLRKFQDNTLTPLEKTFARAYFGTPEQRRKACGELVTRLEQAKHPDDQETAFEIMGFFFQNDVNALVREDASLADRLRDVLKTGLVQPHRVQVMTESGVVPLERGLKPDELRQNFYRECLLAKLENRSVRSVFDESTFRVLDPVANIDNGYYGLTQLKALQKEFFSRGLMSPLDDMSRLVEEDARLRAITDPRTLYVEFDDLLKWVHDDFPGVAAATQRTLSLAYQIHQFRSQPHEDVDQAMQALGGMLHEQADAERVLQGHLYRGLQRGSMMSSQQAEVILNPVIQQVGKFGDDDHLDQLRKVLNRQTFNPAPETDRETALAIVERDLVSAAQAVRQIATRLGPAETYENTDSLKALIDLLDYRSPVLQRLDEGRKAWLEDAVNQLPELPDQPEHGQALAQLKTLVSALGTVPVAKEHEVILGIETIATPMWDRYHQANDRTGATLVSLLLNKIVYALTEFDKTDNPKNPTAMVRAEAVSGLLEVDFSKIKDASLVDTARQRVQKALMEVVRGERHESDEALAALKRLAAKLGIPEAPETQPPTV